jgi:hypothetical protein
METTTLTFVLTIYLGFFAWGAAYVAAYVHCKRNPLRFGPQVQRCSAPRRRVNHRFVIITLHGSIDALGATSSVEAHDYGAGQFSTVLTCIDGGHLHTEFYGDECITPINGPWVETSETEGE